MRRVLDLTSIIKVVRHLASFGGQFRNPIGNAVSCGADLVLFSPRSVDGGICLRFDRPGRRIVGEPLF
jgi:hypothetical protein